MVLTVHAISGAAVGRLAFGNPIIAFCLGFASHFLLDHIPHKEYEIFSVKKNKEKSLIERNFSRKAVLRDILAVSADLSVGMAFVLFVVFRKPENLVVLFSGAMGGVMPDFFQLIYAFYPRGFFAFMQKIHDFSHSRQGVKNPIMAWVFQIVIVVILGATVLL